MDTTKIPQYMKTLLRRWINCGRKTFPNAQCRGWRFYSYNKLIAGIDNGTIFINSKQFDHKGINAHREMLREYVKGLTVFKIEEKEFNF